jgi:Nuclear cap-binding protein subunit 3
VPKHVQWIDDTSANIIYHSKEDALEALLSFTTVPTTVADIYNAPLELRLAKQLASRPTASLQVRVAKVSDRKQKNAKDSSRYYLLHPEHDPAERGDYKRRKYDDREHRRRRGGDDDGGAGNEFAASMYDDVPATDGDATPPARGRDLFSRMSGPDRRRTGRRRSASPGRSINSEEIDVDISDEDGDVRARRRPRRDNYRERDPPPYSRRDPAPFPRENAGKELFGSSSNDTSRSRGGGLVSDKIELKPSPAITSSRKVDQNSSAANRLRADLQAAQTSPGRGSHRRSHAMDAKNAEDLTERFGRKSLSIDSTGKPELFPHMVTGSGLNIRGSADQQGISIKGAGGFSIKGRAAEPKELFPDQYGKGNAGKELFDAPVRERRIRARADDYH